MIKLFSNSKEISLTKSSLESYAEGMNSYLKTGKISQEKFCEFQAWWGRGMQYVSFIKNWINCETIHAENYEKLQTYRLPSLWKKPMSILQKIKRRFIRTVQESAGWMGLEIRKVHWMSMQIQKLQAMTDFKASLSPTCDNRSRRESGLSSSKWMST